jgi:hypothetical protein
MKYLFTLFCLVFCSCIKDYSSTTSSTIINKTNYLIKTEPFLNDIVESSKVISISPNSQKKVIENAMIRGKATGDCFGRLLQPYDSVIVSFNGIKKSVHLKFNSNNTDSNTYILFGNNRSFTNNLNWKKSTWNETKNTLQTVFEFEFTEQDYINKPLFIFYNGIESPAAILFHFFITHQD